MSDATKAEAMTRFRAAMEHVELAQRELARAGGLLASLHGSPSWKLVGAEHDRVLKLWDSLAARRDRKTPVLDLDSYAGPRFERKQASLVGAAVERKSDGATGPGVVPGSAFPPAGAGRKA